MPKRRMGLAQEVVPLGQQLARAIALAETIGNNTPLGVTATLLSARKGIEQGPQAAFNELLPTVLQLIKTQDAQEGIRSLKEHMERSECDDPRKAVVPGVLLESKR